MLGLELGTDAEAPWPCRGMCGSLTSAALKSRSYCLYTGRKSKRCVSGPDSLLKTFIVLLCLGLLCVSSVAVSTPPPAASLFQRHCVAAVHSTWSTTHRYFPSHKYIFFLFIASFLFIFIHLDVSDWVDAPGGAAGGMHGAVLPQQHLFGGLVTSPGFYWLRGEIYNFMLGTGQLFYYYFPCNRVY